MLCKHGLSHHAVSVRVFVTFVDSVETNKHIFKIFSPSDSDTILVFPHQTSWQYSDRDRPNEGIECRCSRLKSLINEYLALRSVTDAPWLVFGTWQLGFCWLRVSDDQAPRAISTVRDWLSTVSCYTQSQSSVNRVYDSKARRYAEDNKTESNCVHWWIWTRSN